MRTFASLIRRFGSVLSRFGTCGVTGFIVGLIVGSLLAMLDFHEGGGLSLVGRDFAWVSVILILTSWSALLTVFVIFVRSRLSSVAAPALVNATLVTLLTIVVCERLGAYAFGTWIGAVIGLTVGSVLCVIHKRLGR